MVDSLPPSGTDPDNQTIITNSNEKLSVPLDGETLDVGSSGKVQVIQSTAYLGNFAQDSGDWTGIDSVSDGIATVNVPDGSTASASVTADLTDIDALNFRINPGGWFDITIYFDGVIEGEIDSVYNFQTLEISGLDYGPNTTVTIEGYNTNNIPESLEIDYVRGNPILKTSESEYTKIELVDAGGL